jgi:hypothetical protein
MKLINCLSLVLLMASASSNAATLTMEHQISALDNLYYTNWGHWWYGPTDGDRLVASNPDGSLGDGAPANYVSFGGAPFAFNVAQIKELTISVSGSVRDLSPTVYTDANGCYSPNVCRAGEDPSFQLFPTYSVIGLWSTTYDHITPVKFDSDGVGYAYGDTGYDNEDFYSTTSAPFFVGTGKSFDFSKMMPASAGSLYLFLAENDGGFSDNIAEDFYTASISIITNEVPVPPAAAFMVSGLLALLGIKSRRTTQLS